MLISRVPIQFFRNQSLQHIILLLLPDFFPVKRSLMSLMHVRMAIVRRSWDGFFYKQKDFSRLSLFSLCPNSIRLPDIISKSVACSATPVSGQKWRTCVSARTAMGPRASN